MRHTTIASAINWFAVPSIESISPEIIEPEIRYSIHREIAAESNSIEDSCMFGPSYLVGAHGDFNVFPGYFEVSNVFNIIAGQLQNVG